MHSYLNHLVYDPLTLKDLIAVTFFIAVAVIILILVIGALWAAIDFFREKGRESAEKVHFKRIANCDDVSRSE